MGFGGWGVWFMVEHVGFRFHMDFASTSTSLGNLVIQLFTRTVPHRVSGFGFGVEGLRLRV